MKPCGRAARWGWSTRCASSLCLICGSPRCGRPVACRSWMGLLLFINTGPCERRRQWIANQESIFVGCICRLDRDSKRKRTQGTKTTTKRSPSSASALQESDRLRVGRRRTEERKTRSPAAIDAMPVVRRNQTDPLCRRIPGKRAYGEEHQPSTHTLRHAPPANELVSFCLSSQGSEWVADTSRIPSAFRGKRPESPGWLQAGSRSVSAKQ